MTTTQQEKTAKATAAVTLHALACTFTDFIDPVIGNWTQQKIDKSKWLSEHISSSSTLQKLFGNGIHVGCGTDHKHGLKHWVLGEFIGDGGAVPLTIAIQRYAPFVVNAIRKVTEPVFGRVFRKGIEREVASEARAHHIPLDSDAYKQRVTELYEHEMEYLPLAVVWNAASIGLNFAGQKFLIHQENKHHKHLHHDHDHHHTLSLGSFLTAKLTGTILTNGAIFATRALIPEKIQAYEDATSRHVVLPLAKKIGRMFGVKEETTEQAMKDNSHHKSWTERIRQNSPENRHSL